MAYCSLQRWNKEYMTFHERFQARYPGYVLDDLMRIRPGPFTRTIDFKDLWDTLVSDD